MPSSHYLILKVGDLHVGLPLHQVERVFSAVALAPAPGGPDILLGLADVAGTWVPVADLARRLGLGASRIRASQAFILVHSARRRLILVVDEVLGQREIAAEDLAPRREVIPGSGTIDLVARQEEGVIWIQDVDRFLAWEEERSIEAVLAESREDSGKDRPS
jgi:purine-binding chemotaxis protein CheW